MTLAAASSGERRIRLDPVGDAILHLLVGQRRPAALVARVAAVGRVAAGRVVAPRADVVVLPGEERAQRFPGVLSPGRVPSRAKDGPNLQSGVPHRAPELVLPPLHQADDGFAAGIIVVRARIGRGGGGGGGCHASSTVVGGGRHAS